ncbi:hypothetical protein C8A00DRAFT_33704 [Chaetomidium leptoderma]|uniref:Uncharacterized protein n=1 Tax=Chaetomidium leptoderma TaxID=669021 RepID=A0AAN6VL34_9PEZI|nr:hypothetical protein C8A00DRAFT_33704 [Chaetomidium leptoderma]
MAPAVKFNAPLALLNIGKATAPLPEMPAADHHRRGAGGAAKREALALALEKEGVMDKVLWLEPGVKTTLA